MFDIADLGGTRTWAFAKGSALREKNENTIFSSVASLKLFIYEFFSVIPGVSFPTKYKYPIVSLDHHV
jgi:hypothetical protein